jgi:hypothetical protein
MGLTAAELVSFLLTLVSKFKSGDATARITHQRGMSHNDAGVKIAQMNGERLKIEVERIAGKIQRRASQFAR